MGFLAALLIVQAAAGQGFGYRNADLGITLAEWRALPFPGSGPSVRALCSDTEPDALAPGGRVELYLPAIDKRLGIVRCVYFSARQIGQQTLWDAAAIDIGTSPYGFYGVQYDFFAGRLFRIYGETNIAAADHAQEGLVARFGRPASAARDFVQNRMGGQFPRIISVWRRGSNSVTLSSPGGDRVDRFSVTYIDERAAARVQAARDQAAPPTDRM